METRGARGPFCALSDRWTPRSASSIPFPSLIQVFHIFPSLIQVFQFFPSAIQDLQPFPPPRFNFSPSSIHSQATPKQTGERTGCTMVAHFLHICVLATPPRPAHKMSVALPSAHRQYQVTLHVAVTHALATADLESSFGVLFWF